MFCWRPSQHGLYWSCITITTLISDLLIFVIKVAVVVAVTTHCSNVIFTAADAIASVNHCLLFFCFLLLLLPCLTVEFAWIDLLLVLLLLALSHCTELLQEVPLLLMLLSMQRKYEGCWHDASCRSMIGLLCYHITCWRIIWRTSLDDINFWCTAKSC